MYLNHNSLKPFNTFKIDVRAKKIFVVKTRFELYDAWYESKKKNLPFLILGEGSNVLFLKKNYNGIVAINRLKGISITEDKNFWYLHIGAGENWHKLVNFSVKNKFFGLENLALIPGCVGSAVVQNIGAYGLELHQFCQYVDILDFKINKVSRLLNKLCKFDYRDSIFQNKYQKNFAILSIGLKLKKEWTPTIVYNDLKKLHLNAITPKKIFNFICQIRKKKMPNPKVFGNAGSFFKNPLLSYSDAKKIFKQFPLIPRYPYDQKRIHLSAGWLIEQCHLKNYCIGDAAVYKKQALIIINKKNATGKDIFLLAQYIFQCVKKKFNILLEPEVNFIEKNFFIRNHINYLYNTF